MKTSAILIQIGLLGFILRPAISNAQDKLPEKVQASVGDVTDNRTTGSFFPGCKVEVKFTGDAVAEAKTIRNVRVFEAVDDMGRDLRLKEDDQNSFGTFEPEHFGDSIKTEVKLRNPSRRATVIKTLRGSAELFNPTDTNGGIIPIKEALRHPAEPIKNSILEKYGVQLVYLTKESYEAKKKEILAKQKTPIVGKFGDAFGELFQGMMGGMLPDSKDVIQMFVDDPQKVIVELEFCDGSGHALKTQGKMTSNQFQQTNFAEPPPADTQLVVHLAVPEATTKCLFELRDIPLP